MLIGYMRVSSTNDRQSVDLQRDALNAASVDSRHLYADKASGAREDRANLIACREYLKAGDTLVVWKLDRLGRSLAHLLSVLTDLRARGVSFRSLTEQMDTGTPHGELLFSLFGALAQYERAFTATGQSDAVVEQLQTAHQLAPLVGDIAIDAATALASRHRYGEAAAAILPIAANPHGGNTERAQALLGRMQAEAAAKP